MGNNYLVFTSPREKRHWFWGFAVFAAIFSTLFIGNPMVKLLSNQNFQAIIFILGMLLIATSTILHGIKTRPGKTELSIQIGIVAVFLMFFLRLGIPERSHLIEYSILAIFIHKAFVERK